MYFDILWDTCLVHVIIYYCIIFFKLKRAIYNVLSSKKKDVYY
ncbi:hypothetical protein HCMG_00201 [Helicobacter canadensis MIT 98-5491]|nr:hypothetical protein HCMG_00201 [Helicobacter canadensis MIT 98-5491]